MIRAFRSGLAALMLLAGVAPALAQSMEPETVLQAVVRVTATIPPDARSAGTLGTEREGSGVTIDSAGLILTIGYLIMEADRVEVETADGRTYPAEIVAYDHTTGFGLLRGQFGFDAKPVRLGSSASIDVGDAMIAVSFGGMAGVVGTAVVSKREFAGYWEYLLDEAIFTVPAHLRFGGAALIDGRGELVGIGSLIVADAAPGSGLPGNMFVPIDALHPILGDLIAFGRSREPPQPWLGVTLREERSRVFIERVAPDGPAEAAGLRRNDLITGVAGEAVGGLADFYRKVRALGPAGVAVPLDILRGTEVETIDIQSIDRTRFLRLNSSF